MILIVKLSSFFIKPKMNPSNLTSYYLFFYLILLYIPVVRVSRGICPINFINSSQNKVVLLEELLY